MDKPFIFDYERYPDWLSELIDKGSVIEGEEPPDQWEKPIWIQSYIVGNPMVKS